MHCVALGASAVVAVSRCYPLRSHCTWLSWRRHCSRRLSCLGRPGRLRWVRPLIMRKCVGHTCQSGSCRPGVGVGVQKPVCRTQRRSSRRLSNSWRWTTVRLRRWYDHDLFVRVYRWTFRVWLVRTQARRLAASAGTDRSESPRTSRPAGGNTDDGSSRPTHHRTLSDTRNDDAPTPKHVTGQPPSTPPATR